MRSEYSDDGKYGWGVRGRRAQDTAIRIVAGRRIPAAEIGVKVQRIGTGNTREGVQDGSTTEIELKLRGTQGAPYNSRVR